MSREEAIEILSDMRAEYNLFGYEEEATRYHVLSWAIQAMKDTQRWIPTSERLPEPNEIVIVSIHGEVDVDWIAVDNTGYKSWYRCMKDVTSVDAWMPRPKPWEYV